MDKIPNSDRFIAVSQHPCINKGELGTVDTRAVFLVKMHTVSGG